MNTPVDERLRRALAEEAEATTMTDDAWARIEARTTGRRRWEVVRRPLVLVPALAVVVVAVLVAVNVREDDGGRLRVAGAPGRLFLSPTGLEDRFELVVAETDPDRGETGLLRVRTFGRPAPNGATVAATATVMVFDPGAAPLVEGAETLPVEGQPVNLTRGPDGNVIVSWSEDGGGDVHLSANGLSDPDLVALVASLRPGPAATAAPALPAGWRLLGDQGGAGRPYEGWLLAHQFWDGGGDVNFSLEITEAPGRAFEDVAAENPGAQVLPVRGTRGLVVPGEQVRLSWLERPGTSVTLLARGLSVDELKEVAEGLEPVSRAEWDALAAAAARGGGDGSRNLTPIASGELNGQAWEAVVVQGDGLPRGDVCLELNGDSGGSGTCFTPGVKLGPGELAELSVSFDGTRDWTFLTGIVGPGVARLEVRPLGGAPVSAVPLGGELGLPFSFVVVPLPTGTTSLTAAALDGGGREVSRQVLAGPPRPRPRPPVPSGPSTPARPGPLAPPTSVPG